MDSLEDYQEKLGKAYGDRDKLIELTIEYNKEFDTQLSLVGDAVELYNRLSNAIKNYQDTLQANKNESEKTRREKQFYVLDNTGVQEDLLGVDWWMPDLPAEEFRRALSEYMKDPEKNIPNGYVVDKDKLRDAIQDYKTLFYETFSDVQNEYTGTHKWNLLDSFWEEFAGDDSISADEMYLKAKKQVEQLNSIDKQLTEIEAQAKRAKNQEELDALMDSYKKVVENAKKAFPLLAKQFDGTFESYAKSYGDILTGKSLTGKEKYEYAKELELELAAEVEKRRRAVKEAYKDSELTDRLAERKNQLAISEANYAAALENTTKAAKQYANEIFKESDSLDESIGKLSKFREKLDLLKNTYKEFDDKGAISTDTLKKISEEFKDLGDDVSGYIWQLMSVKKRSDITPIIEKMVTALVNEQAALGNLNTERATEIALQLKSMGIANSTQVVMSAYAKQLNQMIEYTKSGANLTAEQAGSMLALAQAIGVTSEQLEIYNEIAQVTSTLDRLRALSKDSTLYSQITKQYEAKLSSLKKELKTIKVDPVSIIIKAPKDSSSSSSSSSKDAYLKEFEDWLDKEQYLLNTDQITQEKYLKDLDKKYKNYFAGKKKYLEQEAKYSKEVYDGMKKLYEDDLNKQKDTLSKEKENAEKFYEEQKKLLEEQKKAQDLDDERSDKQKTVNDLKLAIQRLERDTSSAAQRKILELRDQLAEAEEDLNDFEKGNAYDEAIKSLEDKATAEAEAIQKKMDAIDDTLSNMDTNTSAIREAVVKFAKTVYGITISSAYATGTSSARGGIALTQEKGDELLGLKSDRGIFSMLTPGSKVWNAEATNFLYEFANAPFKMLKTLWAKHLTYQV